MLQDWRFITLVAVGLVAVGIWNWSFFKTLNAKKPKPAVHIVLPPESAAVSEGHRAGMSVHGTTFPLQPHMVAVTPVQGPWTEVQPQDLSTRDPFRTTATAIPAQKPTWQPDFLVSAILTGGPQNVAVINGESVAVGDTIAGLSVTEITLGWVILGTGGSRRVIMVE